MQMLCKPVCDDEGRQVMHTCTHRTGSHNNSMEDIMNVWKRISAAGLAVMIGVMGAGAAAADDAEDVPMIEDGRVNAWDIAAPVVVYCTFEYPDEDDTDLGVLDSVELWSVFINEEDAAQGSLALTVTSEEIDAAGVPADEAVVIATDNGVSLYRGVDGSLTAAGAGYTFTWEFGDQGC
jgi:hypothetical protein